ncbi:TetR/AcrR family transcriptional regulator [Nocardia sp. NPDC024068]|uniref:TetR/AcrR family transcriptional regulator n=1 Tax=Nocardia sp. NPDC024068 TaxID=3157197 RepID=UPI0033EDC408
MTSRQERAEETEQSLKAAARRVFAERGYLNTKITDITAAAGRSAGSFYNHFSGKEELLRALLTDLSAAGDEQAGREEHNPDFSDPSAVRFHIAGFWHFAREHAPVLRAMGQAALVNDDFAREMGRFGADQRVDIADHLDGLLAKGLTLPGTVDASLAMMFYLVQAIAAAVEDGALEVSDAEAVESLTRFVYRGLTGRDY